MNYEQRADERRRRDALWGIDWPGHPACGASGPTEQSLQNEPERWRLLCVTDDPNADYSYDDLALMVRDDGLHILVQTSGCSCPSPCETWGIVAEGTPVDMLARVEKERAEWRDGDLRGPWIEMHVRLTSGEVTP